MDALFLFTYQVKSNMQLKYSNYVAFSHFHGCAVNNLGAMYFSYIFSFNFFLQIRFFHLPKPT